MVGRDRREIIDSDGHVIEPEIVWREYADPEFRERLDVPRGGAIQRIATERAYPDANISEVLAPADGEHWGRSVGGETWEEESLLKMGRPGGYDPRARLIDMDAEGIDAAVLYPTAMLSSSREHAHAHPCFICLPPLVQLGA